LNVTAGNVADDVRRRVDGVLWRGELASTLIEAQRPDPSPPPPVVPIGITRSTAERGKRNL
jgi:hypothetical protein